VDGFPRPGGTSMEEELDEIYENQHANVTDLTMDWFWE
jgi:hypothetical protein